MPHSGPCSLYGVLGRVGEAYFQMINDKGGLNGRKIKFLTLDDAYSAPKCVEATRRLVERTAIRNAETTPCDCSRLSGRARKLRIRTVAAASIAASAMSTVTAAAARNSGGRVEI